MKNFIKLIFFSAVAMAFWSSCKRIETEPVYTIDQSLVWNAADSNATVAQFFLNEIYTHLPSGFNRLDGDFLDAGAGDAVPSRRGTSVERFYLGRVNADQNPDPYWDQAYTGIRKVNQFLKNIDRVPVKPETGGADSRLYWKAEARFVRALLYFEMLKRYGGIPLVGDTVFSSNDNFQYPRNTFEDCVNYIVNECDAIKNNLRPDPIASNLWGHVTKGGALALKIRLLLYAASPLYNGGGIETDPAKKILTGYLSYDPTRWNKVVLAAEEMRAVSFFTPFFTTLYKPSATAGYASIFTDRNNNEIILARQRGQSTDIETNNAPVGYTIPASFGRTSPTQDFAEAFSNADGTAFNPTSVNPYVNRDPRFYATLFYNGSQWLQRNVQTFEGGLDKPNSPARPSQTRTGYYLRKFMGNFSTSTTYSNQNHNFPIFRMAEVLLNYAEALNEVGRTADAVAAIRAIRNRAGISSNGNTYGVPSIISQAALRTLIQNERRIELSFEEHRFWDIRRWKIAEQILNGPLYGVKISSDGAVPQKIQVATASFLPRCYHMPIPFSVMLKNPNLVQNEGW